MSLDAQVAKATGYCATKDLAVVGVFRDEGESGGAPLDGRPAGRELTAAIQRGEVAHVVAAKLDRCFRNAGDCTRTVEHWHKVGVSAHLLDLNVDTRTPTGFFFLQIMAACAQLELNNIRDRTRTALAHKRANGELVSAPALGFRATGGGAPAVDNQELPAVRRVLELCEADIPFHRIADMLNDEGVRTKRGGRWHRSTVWKLYRRRDEYAPLLAGAAA